MNTKRTIDLLHIAHTQHKNKNEPIKRHSYDIDTLAFLGFRIEDGLDCSTLPARTIPYGDRIIKSFTVGEYDYYRTYTGYFCKKHQSKEIGVIDEKFFFDKCNSREVFKFCARLGSPQAGLTRGSKRDTELSRLETQKNKILEIQNEYKDGIK